MRIAITGVNGFVGKHLAAELHDNAHEVVGVGIDPDAAPEITHVLAEYIMVDLTKQWPALSGLDAIIHLAGLAAVGPSFAKPQQYIEVNSAMLTHMGEYYLSTDGARPRIVAISSGSVYDPRQTMPLSETSAVAYSSPYAVSKLLVEHQCAYYNSRGLDCVVMRPFNHIGPGQIAGFLVPDLIEKIAARPDTSSPINVGNLATKRDYTDVRDVVRAYRLVATKPSSLDHSLYNVCSGKSLSGDDVLATIARAMDCAPVPTEVDESLMRPNDCMDIRGDNSRLADEFGWQPTISFEQTIKDCVS
ncbi:hypothetical protein CR983_02785 [Candidatus Saccharibacteria bacterium]|nr:MAG: hypothetical protein CR983_02785 [Candidatus Saccharibacteria bacterium]